MRPGERRDRAVLSARRPRPGRLALRLALLTVFCACASMTLAYILMVIFGGNGW